MADLSRRGFIAGGAVLGTLAALNLSGCAQPKTASQATGTSQEAADWAKRLNVDIASTLPGNTRESLTPTQTKECDVVVIGAGCSGTLTAVRAAQAGLSVILCEKTQTIGGASLKSWAPSAYNSKYAKAAGVVTDTDPIIEKWVADCHWRVDASAIRQLVNTAGEAIDWMSDNGWEFTYLGMGADITMLPDYALREGLFQSMLESSVKKQGEVLTSTTVKQLVTNDAGDVIGALVQDGSGTTTQINARACVIATGGYGANLDMVKAAFGFGGVFAGLPQNIGEGLEMAWAQGAAKAQNFGSQMLHQTLARATDKLIGLFDPFPAKYPMILCYVANVLNVNRTGQRFRSEALTLDAVPSANSSAYQGSYHYVIVSQTVMDALEDGGLAALGVDYAPGLPPEFKPAYELDTPWTGIRDVFDAMVESGSGFKGSTPEELAAQAGMDAATLARQIEQYNEFCRSGADTQFGKSAKYLYELGSGPYYAIIAEENNLCSWGGLITNTDYQVLNDDRVAIKGLYAVGNEAGSNLYNDTYVGFGYGMANTITSGYICGGKLGEALKTR